MPASLRRAGLSQSFRASRSLRLIHPERHLGRRQPSDVLTAVALPAQAIPHSPSRKQGNLGMSLMATTGVLNPQLRLAGQDVPDR